MLLLKFVNSNFLLKNGIIYLLYELKFDLEFFLLLLNQLSIFFIISFFYLESKNSIRV